MGTESEGDTPADARGRQSSSEDRSSASCSSGSRSSSRRREDAGSGGGSGAMMTLTATLVSGRSSTVTVRTDATLLDLQEAISKGLAVPVPEQRLLAGGKQLKSGIAGGGRSLAELEIEDGALIEVVRVKWVPPVLPPRFLVKLTSARERLGEDRYSSAFLIVYEFEVDVPKSHVVMRLWRKNDHDEFEYDFEKRTVTQHIQHWMAGTTTNEKKLGIKTPLPELLQMWLQKPTPVSAEDAFWKEAPPPAAEASSSSSRPPGAAGLRARPSSSSCQEEEEERNPKPSARPGWFVHPGGECTELALDLPMASEPVRLRRVLVDEEGIPVRAALIGTYAKPHWDKVEEYDVEFYAWAEEHEELEEEEGA